MGYDILMLKVWLAPAAILGLAVGWTRYEADGVFNLFRGWFGLGVIAALFGLIFAWNQALPGRGGFWLESALLFFAAYGGGCLIGGVFASLVSRPVPATVRSGRPTTPAPAAPSPSPQTPSSLVRRETEPTTPQTLARRPAPSATAVEFARGPARAARIEGEELYPGARPPGFAVPRGGLPDDLKRINGVDDDNEGRLHTLGVWHFDQIASWTPDNVAWIASYLGLPGRIEHEDWVGQARSLASGG